MYLDFFGFSEKPFAITPNPHFIFLSKNHKEVFAHLFFGIRNRTGFVEVTGEVGSGKTTILRTLFNQIDNDEHRLAFIFNPSLSSLDLMRAINREYHIDADCDTVGNLFDVLYQFLLRENTQGRTVVLVIDEAQNLAPEVLEQIRQLSNLETETEKLIQIVLVGQPELGATLARPELRQLSQRITLRYHLSPMDLEDTRAYINHRLELVGNRNPQLVTAGALKKIFNYSGGLPRLINVICDRALVVAYGEDRREIGVDFVDTAIAELRRDHDIKMVRKGRLRWVVAAGGVLLVLGASLGARQLAVPTPVLLPPPVAVAPVVSVQTSEKVETEAKVVVSEPVALAPPAAVVEAPRSEPPAAEKPKAEIVKKISSVVEPAQVAKAAVHPEVKKAVKEKVVEVPVAKITEAPKPVARPEPEPSPKAEPLVVAQASSQEPQREKIIFGFAPSWNSSIRTMEQAKRLAQLLQPRYGAEIEVRMFRDEQVLRDRLSSGEGLDFALVHQGCREDAASRTLAVLKRQTSPDCGFALSGKSMERQERQHLSSSLARLEKSAEGRRLLSELGIEDIQGPGKAGLADSSKTRGSK